MKMCSENYSKEAKLKQDREGAKHGEFFLIILRGLLVDSLILEQSKESKTVYTFSFTIR